MRLTFSQFSWGSSQFNVGVLKEQKVMLPTKRGKVDFDFMDNFISAIQKLVIQDVVAYSSQKLAAAKKIIDQQ